MKMFKYIPGNHNLIISTNGEIRTSDGLMPLLERDRNLVKVQLYGIPEILDVSWLALLANFEIDLPNHFKSITFYDANPRSFSTNTGKIAKSKRPIVIDKKYRLIPNHPHYAVSMDGVVIVVKTKAVVDRNESEDGYPSVTIYDPDQNRFRKVLIHRLVALVWCRNEDYVTKPIVNHIDGNKKNSYYKNLEWCSYSENVRHAIDNGLTGGHKSAKFKVRDIETGAVCEYKTITELAREIGLANHERWRIREYKTQPTIVMDRYEVKHVDDASPWTDRDAIGVKKNKHTIHVTFPDGKIEIFGDNVSLMKRFKIWNISYNVREIARVLVEKYPNHKVEIVENHTTKPAEALNVLTGEVIDGDTLRQLALLTGNAYSSVHKAVTSNDLCVRNGYIFRYKSEDPWPDTFRRNPNSPKPYRARNVRTDEIVLFPSEGAILKTLSVSRFVLYSRIQNKELIGDWEISEVI